MNEIAVTAVPATSAGLDPNRYATRPATAPSTPMLRAAGSRYRLETTTDAPNPKPVLLGSCANCGYTMNDAYIPAPSRNATRFVVHTPRIRIIAMSISGSRLWTSTQIHAAITSAPAANSAIVLAPPQPQTVVCAIPISTKQIPTLISVAASQFTRPGERIGDSGTNRHVHTAATRVTTSGSQNSQCQLRCSTITPPRTRPKPLPIPSTAEIRPMLPATL